MIGIRTRSVSGFNFKYVELDPEAPAWIWQETD